MPCCSVDGPGQRPLLDGFEEVVREDGRLGAQLGEGSGHLNNPVIGAGTQSQLPNGTGQELLARIPS